MIELLIGSALRALVVGLIAGLVLKVRRTRNPHLEMSVWRGVLAASLAMPVLMQLPVLPLPILTRQFAHFPLDPAALPSLLAPTVPDVSAAWNWHAAVLLFYAAIALSLLFKPLLGLWASGRLVRKAIPIAGYDARMSEAVAVPITIGRTVLLPPDFASWDAATLQAVLAHEGAHARRGDYYLLLAADLHKALFWFSPLAWWLRSRLAHLAEALSDDAAIAQSGDRPSYAEILLGFAGRAGRSTAGLAMARPGGIAGRIDRILGETTLAAPPSLKRKALAVLAAVPVLLAVACLTVTARAEPVSGDEKLDITSEGAIQFSPDSKSITAQGDVKALLHGKVTMTGDSLVADYADDAQGGSKVTSVKVTGGVEVSSQTQSVRGDQAIYSPASGTISVTGKVQATEGGKTVTGGRAVFDTDKDTVRVYP